MKQIKSPNFSSREGHKVLAVVIHVADGSKEAVTQTFTNPATKVSSHYLVCENGDVINFVSENDSAWANGKKVSPTAKVVLDNPDVNPNFFTLSIENEGWGNKDINDVMYKANAELVKDICQRYGLPINRKTVIGHREIRADKVCPGKINLNKIIDIALNLPDVSYTQPKEVDLEKKIDILSKLIDLYKKLINLIINKGK